jgi:hypothetical protein
MRRLVDIFRTLEMTGGAELPASIFTPMAVSQAASVEYSTVFAGSHR